MNLNKYLDVNPEVAAAIAEGKPVQEIDTARLVTTLRELGAVI